VGAFLYLEYDTSMEQIVRTLEEFQKIAEAFARALRPRAESATLVTLSGELGAGKTVFVKAAAKTLGIEEVVNSPTFVLEKIYNLEDQKFAHLIHIDAYRLESGAELAPLGFDELMNDPENLIFLEWPEKVADALPVPATRINLESLPNGARRVRLDK